MWLLPGPEGADFALDAGGPGRQEPAYLCEHACEHSSGEISDSMQRTQRPLGWVPLLGCPAARRALIISDQAPVWAGKESEQFSSGGFANHLCPGAVGGGVF